MPSFLRGEIILFAEGSPVANPPEADQMRLRQSLICIQATFSTAPISVFLGPVLMSQGFMAGLMDKPAFPAASNIIIAPSMDKNGRD
jgi:hypothetical protein